MSPSVSAFMVREWENEFETNKEHFFARIMQSVEQGNYHDSLFWLPDHLTNHILQLIDMKRTQLIESLQPYIGTLLKKITYQREKPPGVYVVKGKLETLLKLTNHYTAQQPAEEWLRSLRSQYDKGILRFLFNKRQEMTSAIAEFLEIQPSQLTRILNRLENDGFIIRETIGKTIWNRLTKKGLTVVEYLESHEALDPVKESLQYALSLIKDKQPSKKLNTYIERFQTSRPDIYELLLMIRDTLDATPKQVVAKPDIVVTHTLTKGDLIIGIKNKNAVMYQNPPFSMREFSKVIQVPQEGTVKL